MENKIQMKIHGGGFGRGGLALFSIFFKSRSMDGSNSTFTVA
jgi:hypothetical protein